MDNLYRSFPPEVWLRVVNHITHMEDVCRFSMISEYFYRLINTDFRSLCYKNMVFRLPGETWATAFS
ncbi:unnamed protein product [Bursaphelenchus okinawaensis]|uniref:F-box domain-containing protein n=1 Tax=Bursaphelenchus okinawaensis TaxID=465554 RepID=A0A811KTQ4_9BILA|nr:unnamed protein product [Bursaphelenchus okinawaensis]CAG9112603.1 unnamed protein product [Bursaphelenchus okinawaensis]